MRAWLRAAAAYALLTVLLTWPVAPRLFSHVPFYNDTWIFVWDVHQVRRALLDPHARVFETDRIFHPDGISLAFHTLTPLNGALALPLEPLLGLIGTYNLLFLAWSWLTALAGFGLALRLTGSAGAAFVSGALLAFSPWRLAHGPHLNLLALAPLPLVAWALLAFLATASRSAALALAVAGALAFYACHEYALFSLLLALLLLGHGLATSGRGSVRLAPLPDLLGRGLGAAALALGLAAPGLVPMLAEAAIERHYAERVDAWFSADLLAWVTPSVLHPLWGGYTMKVYQNFPGVLAEWTTYVGVVVAALVLLALASRRAAPAGVWVTVGAAFALLALGPSLRLLGRELPVPLPYRLLTALPVLSAMREPARFAAGVTLATSLLGGIGFQRLRASRLGRAAWLALPLALLDSLQAPLPDRLMSRARPPAFLADLGRDRDDYAVLDVPAGLEIREHLWHQAVHGKRIFLGYVARIPEASRRFVETLPLLADPAGWPAGAGADRRYLALARRYRVRYALVHADFYARRGEPERFERALDRLLALPGARLAAREGGFAAVRLDGR